MKLLQKNNEFYENVKNIIKKVYLSNDRPFVIGFSGGKDSSLVTQLFIEVLMTLDKDDLKNHVYIISSDTLVENPMITIRLKEIFYQLDNMLKNSKLPVSTHIIKPTTDQTFWANIIGRGYPSPNQTFRWCTNRMKIDPANEFIKEVVSKHGEVIMVLGVREGESASRDRVLDSHSIEGKILMKHTTMNNAYIFAPIKQFTIDDVWDYLLTYDSPWGGDNQDLYRMYADSNSEECPLVIDEETKEKAGSCGNSRFGCWTCTVVSKDKSLTGFIENGINWLKPMLKFRNWLTIIRDDREMRMKRRTSGSIYFSNVKFINDKIIIPKKSERDKVEICKIGDNWIDNENNNWNVFNNEKDAINYIKQNNIDLSSSYDPKIIAMQKDGNYGILGLGPFTFEGRKLILRKLLETQKLIGDKYQLISKDELNEIRNIWLMRGDLEDSLPKIYKDILGNGIKFIINDNSVISDYDLSILNELCKDVGVDFNVYKRLLNLSNRDFGNIIRRNTVSEIAKILKMEFLHIGD